MATDCDANASFNSTRSRLSIVHEALRRASLIAVIGPKPCQHRKDRSIHFRLLSVEEKIIEEYLPSPMDRDLFEPMKRHEPTAAVVFLLQFRTNKERVRPRHR